jgi:hypothetical protein
MPSHSKAGFTIFIRERNNMHTLTIQITDSKALKAIHALEEKQVLKIVEDSAFDSPSLAGKPLTLTSFKKWIDIAENLPSISLQDANIQWAQKRKQLRKLTK